MGIPEDAEAPSVDPSALYEQLAAGEPVSILDVRDRDEFEAWHITGPTVQAEQVSQAKVLQAEVTERISELVAELALAEPIIAVCAEGDASAYVANLLRDEGIEAVNLADGMAGWARVLVAADISPAIRQYYRPSSGCVSYLVHDGGEGVLIDPLRAFTERYLDDLTADDSTLTYALDTHVHADHISGIRSLATQTTAECVLPAGARDRGLTVDATLVQDGEALTIGGLEITAFHLPGHTTEMTGYRVGEVLLTGDSLFLESVARPDLEAGAEHARSFASELYDSLHDRLETLPDATLIAPGHVGPTTTPADDGTYTARLGVLRDSLALLGLDRDAFIDAVLADMPPQPANYETIIETNLGRIETTPMEAFELELGPNNCAVSA